MMGTSKLTDIDAEIIAETERAYLLFDGKVQEWVPKAQCQDNEDGSFTLPVSVAQEKGFV